MALDPAGGTTPGTSNSITIDREMVFKFDTTFLSNVTLKINKDATLNIGENGSAGLAFNSKLNAFVTNNGNLFFGFINFTNTNSLLAIYTFVNNSHVTFKGFADLEILLSIYK